MRYVPSATMHIAIRPNKQFIVRAFLEKHVILHYTAPKISAKVQLVIQQFVSEAVVFKWCEAGRDDKH